MYIYIKIIAWPNFCCITKSEGKTIPWMHRQIITTTSQWARWRLKSPASPLFTQLFIRAQIKESIKAPRHWLLWGEFIGYRWIPAQMASNAENVSICWRHHDLTGMKKCYSSLCLNASPLPTSLHYDPGILLCGIICKCIAIQNTDIETCAWLCNIANLFVNAHSSNNDMTWQEMAQHVRELILLYTVMFD